jgi:hypothetical protein
MKPKPVTSWDDVPIVMDMPMAARIVGQCPEYLKKRAQRGTFPAYKEGSQWRVSKAALKEHIEHHGAAKR